MNKQTRTAIVLCWLFCLPTWARQNAAAARPEISGSRITLDVTVTAKSGQTVSGLTEQDFTLLDNKQPQKILSFRAIQGASTPPPVEVILVLDEVNDSFTNVAYERSQIASFLQQNGSELPAPLSLVFFSDKGASLPTNPTLDGKALIAALNQDKNPQHTIRRSEGFYGAGDRLSLSIQTLGQIADYETRRPGRKLVIWISPGWPLLTGPNIQLTAKNQEQLFNTVVALSTGLRKAGITLYSVDPLGTSDSGGLRTSYYKEFLKGVKKPSQVQYGNVGLQVLAYQSGGRVLNSSNDISAEIASCISDARSFYVLSFDAAPADGPNDYHALDVKVNKTGVTVRTRSGYYAQPKDSR